MYTEKEINNYHIDKEISSRVEKISIEDCYFINSRGKNGIALYLVLTEKFSFKKNTIQDCRNGKFIFTVITTKYVDDFVVEDCTFQHNFFDDTKIEGSNYSDGGGSGIWIANDKNLVPRGSYNRITFYNCAWIDNSAKQYGGAFTYGYSQTVVNTELIFNRCNVINNLARGQHAGALYLKTAQPLLINNCTFAYNKASGTGASGGAIVIESESPSLNIVSCSFTGDNAKDGSAIYVKKLTKDINVTECTFTDCGEYGSVILVESKIFTLDTSYVIFTHSKGSRGIAFSARCQAIIRDSQFIKCRSTSNGGSLFYENTLKTQDEECLLIEGSLFNGCVADNGAALLAKLDSPIQLRNNLFWNQVNGKFILSVFYQSYVNETTVEDCYFEHNLFTKNSRDGGGSGIWILERLMIYNYLTFLF